MKVTQYEHCGGYSNDYSENNIGGDNGNKDKGGGS